MKFLIWALVIYLAWRWYETKKLKAEDVSASAADPEDQAEKMVACTHCGMHLALSEAVAGTGSRYFCSDAHRANHSDR